MSFTTVFGDAPHVRVMDFLLEARAPDHTLTDIARGARVARPTVYKVMGEFVHRGLVSETRTVGNSRFFALNEKDRAVRALAKAAPHMEARSR